MKFNFDVIRNPLPDKDNNNNKVVGDLRGLDGHYHKVSVERRLNGWKINLKITIDDVVWHDEVPEKENIHQFNILIDKAQENEYQQRHEYITKARNAADILILRKNDL
jgi:hypothetical protein